MKKYLIYFILTTAIFVSNAQVPNDDCSTATDLGTLSWNINVCSDGTSNSSIVSSGNTSGATPSSPYYYMSNCYGYLDSTTTLADDIWFKFKTPSTGIILRFPTSDTAHINLYHGTDCNNLQASGCWTHDVTQWERDFYSYSSSNDTSIWNYIQISGTSPGNSLMYGICLRMWISGVPFGVIKVNNNVNVEEKSLDIFNLQLSPNPSIGDFELQLNGDLSNTVLIEIIDIMGRVVYSQELKSYKRKNKITLPEEISNGLYNCVITSGEAKVSKKIVVLKQ